MGDRMNTRITGFPHFPPDAYTDRLVPASAKDYRWRGVNLLILAGWLAYVCIADRNLLAIQVAALFMVMVSVSDFVTAHRMRRPTTNKHNKIRE
jgi:hypothetical protein